MDFSGSVGGGRRVNLGGAGHGRNRPRGGAEESRADFVKRQHKEREARELERLKIKAATQIQSVYRRYRCLKLAKAERRQTFDKRSADITKIGGLLPVDQKAKFVFHALVPPDINKIGLLRLFAFFFTRGQDEGRLGALLELLFFSAAQAPACNILRLSLADDDTQRRSCLVLVAKLVEALRVVGRTEEIAKLLLSVQAAAASTAELRPRVSAAVGYILRRTSALTVLTREVFPRSGESQQAAAQTLDLALICCLGAEACEASAERRQIILRLLSAPQFGELLCQTLGPANQECLRHLSQLLPAVPAAQEHEGLVKLLSEEILGSTRQTWLLGNLLTILELLASSVNTLGSEGIATVPMWLTWVCWSREAGGKGAATNAQDGRFAAQLERLSAAPLVRALSQVVDRNPDGLLAVCRLYFFNRDPDKPDKDARVLQTFAWSTNFAERLLPTISHLISNPSIEAVFSTLGPPSFDTPDAIRLQTFCSIYAMQMQPMYDYEFFGAANPLRLQEIQILAPFLNRLAYLFVTLFPDKSVLEPEAKSLRLSITSIVRSLYNRHCRKPLLADGSSWIIADSHLLTRRAPVVDLGADGDDNTTADAERDSEMRDPGSPHEQERMDVDDATQAQGGFARAAASQGSDRRVLEAVLDEVPQVVPFQDRVALLQNVIQDDQDQRRDTRGPWAQSAMQRHQIRRNFLVEDAFAAFDGLSDEQLKDVFRVEFIAPDGEPESGVDGGGLFKEFLVTIGRMMFTPEFGMFSETDEQTLYPSAASFRVHERALELYAFLGKLVGKALYETFLLEPQFSRAFLNKLLNRTNEVDDLAALDRELHRNMLRIKESQDNVDELLLTFSVSVSEMGFTEEIDLVHNGRNIAVTRENLTTYLYTMANFKTNIQFQRQTAAFVKGLHCVIPHSWLRMFDPYELNILISGSTSGFDVQDLRNNTNYSGGYQDDSPVVMWLWEFLAHGMDPEDMGRFLMFATSCSRAPLLGFKTLFPKFCIHRVPDGVRLPTASTCANLLKLPDYASPEVLRHKLIQAIRAEAGFDLS